MSKINWSGIDGKTIGLAIVAIIVAINTVLTMFGLSPIPYDQDTIVTFITALVTVIVMIVTAWKNFNLTTAAQEGQHVIDAIKSGDEVIVEVEPKK